MQEVTERQKEVKKENCFWEKRWNVIKCKRMGSVCAAWEYQSFHLFGMSHFFCQVPSIVLAGSSQVESKYFLCQLQLNVLHLCWEHSVGWTSFQFTWMPFLLTLFSLCLTKQPSPRSQVLLIYISLRYWYNFCHQQFYLSRAVVLAIRCPELRGSSLGQTAVRHSICRFIHPFPFPLVYPAHGTISLSKKHMALWGTTSVRWY